MNKEKTSRLAIFLLVSSVPAVFVAVASAGATGQIWMVYLAIACGFYAPLALLGGLALAIVSLFTRD